MSDLGEEDVCDVGYEPPLEVKCPCTKLSGACCKGSLQFKTTNAHVAFLLCDRCGCCYHVRKIKEKP